eukprot:3403861-Pleurochrysis_carterae.AAC.1
MEGASATTFSLTPSTLDCLNVAPPELTPPLWPRHPALLSRSAVSSKPTSRMADHLLSAIASTSLVSQ